MSLQTESGKNIERKMNNEVSKSQCNKSKWISLGFTICSMILSFLASYAFTKKWFKITSRGIFICCMAVSNILSRLLQYILVQKKLRKARAELYNAVSYRRREEDRYDAAVVAREKELDQWFEGGTIKKRDEYDKADNIDLDATYDQEAKAADNKSKANEKRYTTMFIVISTFSDCIFDVLQGVIFHASFLIFSYLYIDIYIQV